MYKIGHIVNLLAERQHREQNGERPPVDKSGSLSNCATEGQEAPFLSHKTINRASFARQNRFCAHEHRHKTLSRAVSTAGGLIPAQGLMVIRPRSIAQEQRR